MLKPFKLPLILELWQEQTERWAGQIISMSITYLHLGTHSIYEYGIR